MAHDEFNSGARHGFNMALLAVRNVDKNIKYPETHGKLGEIPWQEQNIIYNARLSSFTKKVLINDILMAYGKAVVA